MIKKFKYYRLNYQITASQIRLLDETGKQIGIVSKFEALKRAQAENKDLVEIAPNANPPVVKLIEFKKFKYLEAKKERASRKSAKHVGTKEIRLSPFMGEHDLQIKIKQAENFLTNGNQLKISVVFKKREITRKEFGNKILNKTFDQLQSVAKVVKLPHFEGRFLVAILTPVKIITKKQDAKSQNEKITAQTL